MAVDPEALVQISRLLHDDGLRDSSREDVQHAVDEAFDTLVDGIVAEAAASDDVMDQESAMSFARLRVQSLSGLLTESQAGRLLTTVQTRIQTW